MGCQNFSASRDTDGDLSSLELSSLQVEGLLLFALEPNDLEKLFVERANAGDLDGLLALYEPYATLVNDDGQVFEGLEQIRAFFETFLAGQPQLSPSDQSPAVISGNIALTSSHLASGDVTAEIARRQPDGTWLWVVDHFALVPGD